MVTKSIAMGNPNPASGRSHAEVQRYWAEVHGKLVANSAAIQRYLHFFSLPEAFEMDPPANFTGVSVFWRDFSVQTAGMSWADMSVSTSNDSMMILRNATGADDRQLFDRVVEWPRHEKRVDVTGEEHIILDGQTTPSMINCFYAVAKRPGLGYREFFEHWLDVQGPLVATLPGLRHYAQYHAVTDQLVSRSMTHDGWSELWFDDLDALKRAMASPEWAAAQADGRMLFAAGAGIVIGPVYVQKDETWKPRDYGANSMSEEEVRARLQREGYASLAADPTAPAKIKAAAAKGLLGVWTDEHLVTLDESRIDERPPRR